MGETLGVINAMRLIFFILILTICSPAIFGQGLNNMTSCQTSRNYNVIEKLNVSSSFQKSLNDSILLVISDSLPPFKWWENIKTKSQNKTSEKYLSYTKGKKYSNQLLVKILNISNRSIKVVLPDRMLMLGLQAKNAKGEWIDCEEFFTSICRLSFSNSYNDTIMQEQTWLTFTELFSGSLKTKYRLKFLIDFPYSGKEKQYIYSNEVEGTIDECRFLRK